jgi:acyl dehydratase
MQKLNSYDDLATGMLMPVLHREIDRQQLIRFAGAVDDYAEPHWDHLYMVQRGFPGVIVHGWLTFAVMCQVVSAWIPLELADLTRFSVRYFKPNLPGPASYGGRVVAKTVLPDSREAELEIWADAPDGSRLASGKVTLRFPQA